MNKIFTPIITLLLCGALSAPLMAQTETAPNIAQPEKPISNFEKSTSSGIGISGFASDLLNDQKDIWTSPLHIKRGDVEWLAPIGAAGVALFQFDHRISDAAK